MDIDQFLEQEKDVVNESFKPDMAKPEPEPARPDEKPSPKADEDSKEIVNLINKGDLENAEKAYSRIWAKVAENKFKWDQGIYDQLTQLNSLISQRLSQINAETSMNLAEIRSLIKATQENIAAGKIEEACAVYHNIDKLYHGLPNFSLKEKKEIYINEVLPLYREIISQTERKFLTSFASRINMVKSEILAAGRGIIDDKTEEAFRNFTDGVLTANSLPEGCLNEKIELGRQLVELYKDISIIIEIKELKSKLEPQLRAVSAGMGMQEGLSQQIILPPSPPIIEKKREDYPHAGQGTRISSTGMNGQAAKAGSKALAQTVKAVPSKTAKADLLNEENPGMNGNAIMHKMPELSASLKNELVRRKLERAEIHISRKMVKDAKRELEYVLKLEPSNAKAKELIGKVREPLHALKESNAEKQAPRLRQHEAFIPRKKPEISQRLKDELVMRKLERAEIHISRKMVKDAKRELEYVLKLEPSNAKAKELIGRLAL